jgi:hypothetical protein
MLQRWLHPDYNLFSAAYWLGQVPTRGLSLFRIAFGLILLKDALFHLPLAHLLYSDEGIVPFVALQDGLLRAWRWSLLDVLPSTWMVVAFVLVWCAVLVGLVLGWRTRWLAILNFVMLVSIHERNVFVLSGADSVLRVMSFWMMFVPLSHHYSLDARHHAATDTPHTTFALPVRLMMLQVVVIYVFTFTLKLYGGAWRDGEALFYALQLQTLTLPTGDWVMAHAPMWFFQLGTGYTLLSEGAFAPLVLSPIGQPWLRRAGLLMSGALHLGIAVLMSVPDFSVAMLACYLLFASPSTLDSIDSRARAFVQARLPGFLPGRLPAWLARWLATTPAPQRKPKPPHRAARAVGVALLLWVAVCVVWWNLDRIIIDEFGKRWELPRDVPLYQQMDMTMQLTGLWQYWGMFSPYPMTADGWIVVVGRFEDGTSYDLRTGGPVAATLPRVYFGPDQRWKKFDENMNRDRQAPLLRAWARYYCQLYNEALARPQGQRLATLEIRYRYRNSAHPSVYRPDVPSPTQEDTLWRHWCYPEYRY